MPAEIIVALRCDVCGATAPTTAVAVAHGHVVRGRAAFDIREPDGWTIRPDYSSAVQTFWCECPQHEKDA